MFDPLASIREDGGERRGGGGGPGRSEQRVDEGTRVRVRKKNR